ncbi:hypothetical protein DFR86_05690 [Acidianus sulfidivorans JP7]|uniref:Uncharacterized protein n=1 Tax=Acidianus sulfidivorans JP7 TaxID=619593 RepID=A0A2U9IQE3_9CREN|nr:hypothetical protein [Acidianus sulfidivorans]AWR98251.1 hypothetical protein DFR86_05690 [Acidianus sulfidivorans JP7]
MSSDQTKQPLVTKTLIKCMSCDYTLERDFQEGDFVPKIVGTCPKDGGKLYIAGIYAVKIAEQKR